MITDRGRLSVQRGGGGSPHGDLLHLPAVGQGAGGDLPAPAGQPRPGADRLSLGLRPVLLPAPNVAGGDSARLLERLHLSPIEEGEEEQLNINLVQKLYWELGGTAVKQTSWRINIKY